MAIRSAGDFFRNLTIRRKLFMIVLFATMSTAVLLYLVLQRQSNAISEAGRERTGIEYILPMQQLLQAVQQHRDLASAVLAGDTSFQPKLAQSTQDVDTAMAALLAADGKFAGQLHTRGRVTAIKQAWQDLAANTASLPAKASYDQHTALISSKIIPLIYDAGDASHLLLDPRAVTYHTAAALIDNVPQTTEALSESRAQIVTLIAANPPTKADRTLSAVDRASLTTVIGNINSNQALIDRVLGAVEAADSSLKPEFDGPIQASDGGAQQYLADVRTYVLDVKGLSADATTMYDKATKAIDSTFQLNHSSSDVLHRLISTRVSSATQNRDLAFGVAIGGIALTSLLILSVVLSVSNRISGLVGLADRISLGELDAHVDTEDGDEFGELARSLARMQSSLQAAIERLRTRRAS